jgi:hypothetical protein
MNRHAWVTLALVAMTNLTWAEEKKIQVMPVLKTKPVAANAVVKKEIPLPVKANILPLTPKQRLEAINQVQKAMDLPITASAPGPTASYSLAKMGDAKGGIQLEHPDWINDKAADFTLNCQNCGLIVSYLASGPNKILFVDCSLQTSDAQVTVGTRESVKPSGATAPTIQTASGTTQVMGGHILIPFRTDATYRTGSYVNFDISGFSVASAAAIWPTDKCDITEF